MIDDLSSCFALHTQTLSEFPMKFYDLSWSSESGEGSTRSYTIIKDLVYEVSS
ncbi:hypothetical protein SLEP1_g19432 [Rubroshorea leprosula]|uniref:Uncharacterized protein n=1 Tax=Rubroshorea leprosula TaxID=152421 RepID=A0AAV5JB75_9ROSI|nr:hypothetical protein SLEP1_g19432 [Rubroshorea leprosula]